MLDAAVAAEVARIDQLFGAGQLRQAEDHCRQLLAVAPASAQGWFRLGILLLARGECYGAEQALREALAHAPQAATILNQLGAALQRQGLAAEAEEVLRQAVFFEPQGAAHWQLLGSVLYDQRKLDAAVDAYGQSLAIDPRNPTAWNELAIAEQERGQLPAAEQAFQKSLLLDPNHLEPLANYAFFLCSSGQREKAWQALQPMVIRDPFASQPWMTLGSLFEAMYEWDLAAAAYRRSLEVAPDHPQAGRKLAGALHAEGKPSAAEEVLRSHLARFPDDADAVALLGEVMMRQCRVTEGIEIAERALSQSPNAQRHSRLLLETQYDENVSLQQLFLAHRQWNATYAKSLLPAQSTRAPLPVEAPLRIGILTREFGQSPAAFLVLPCLEKLQASGCVVFCYSDRTNDDEYTARFRTAAARWRIVFGQSDEQVATLIQRDKIDLLIDLMGHTGRRMLVCARRPAPLQMSWFGYVGTTGMPAIDFVLADRFHVREGEERWYAERVLRMPHSYACYGPPADVPDVGPLPALATGRIAFGCFNNPPKYSPSIRAAWAEILRRVPTASLLLKFQGLDEPKLQGDLRRWFADHGVAGERILLEGWSPHRQLLDAYNRVDLALDTQPYSGGLTTCEALWMGVPVVTFPGQTFAGRHSTSYLTTADHPEFIAKDAAGYVELAVEWAQRIEELAKLRAQMREQIRATLLCDAKQFASDFLEILGAACGRPG
jgi:protein O-GlcNAc transferase